MKPNPLRSLSVPGYPTKLQILATPGLLEKALPAAWRQSEALSAVAALALLAQTACGPLADEVASGRSSLVAPVPARGEGVAGVGCVVVAPPVFLSEEEALKVIREEAARRGLQLVPPERPVLGASVLVTRAPDESGKAQAEPFVPDLADLRKHVAVEFVSQDDADRHGQVQGEDGTVLWSSAYGIETRKAAEELAAHVHKNGTTGLYFGTFYDPAGNVPTRESLAKISENRELLRAQVVDFLDWLQAQGAL